MSGRKKNTVRKGTGTMCNIYGRNLGRGGPLKRHVEKTHGVRYSAYKKCFYGDVKTLISDSWDDTVQTKGGDTVMVHVLARRFIGDPGPRGATRSARPREKK